MKTVIATLLILAASPSYSAESLVHGVAADGGQFEFTLGGPIPDGASYDTLPLLQHFSVIKKPRSSSSKDSAVQLRDGSSCVHLSVSAGHGIISCSDNALFGFRNAVFVERKPGKYACARNCSKKIPRTIFVSDIPPGC